jgi:glyoxylate/hydroxypyruvate reductase A
MSKAPKIAICTRPPFSERCEAIARVELASAGIPIASVVRLDAAEIFEKSAGIPCVEVVCDYLLAWRPPQGLFDWLTVRKAVFSMGAGVDQLLEIAIPEELPVVKIEDAGMGEQIADYVLASVLRFQRELEVYRVQQQQSNWSRRRGIDKRSLQVGVLGLGSIGARIAKQLAHFGFKVRGFSRTPRQIPGVMTTHGDASRLTAEDPASPFSQFLSGLNILISILPASERTRGVLGRCVFSRLASRAQVVNVGRGMHVAEQELFEALADGSLSGATLDVFDAEPLPQAHPFWSHQAIVVTPHIAAVMDTTLCVQQIIGKIAAMELGRPITGVVDRALQY